MKTTKLPKPVTVAIVFATGEKIPGYTVEQMMAWGKACAEACAEREREACAELIEAYPEWLGANAKQEISAAIRARGTP